MPYSLFWLLAGLAWTTASTTRVSIPQTAGCGQMHAGTGTLKHFSLSSGGVLRDFAVYLPTNYYSNSPTPLILSFHGNGKNMDYQARLSRFTEAIINNDTIAVFPNGLTAGDPPKRCWEGAPYCTTGISDQVFVSDLLSYMRGHYCIDHNRIYASGKSIGGGFVDVLACSPDHGQDFAAFAMDAAALYTEADGSKCDPPHWKTPILELHGTNDTIAGYNGDTSHGATLPSIRGVLKTWATRNGCGPSAAPVIDKLETGNVYYTQYNCGGRKGIVVGYNVTGQGHNWISTAANNDNDGNTAPVDASTIMMDFFRANPKPWCWPPVKLVSDRRQCQKRREGNQAG